jgi:hypothetical protein
VLLLLAGCDNGGRRTVPPPPSRHGSLLALDREHQRLVAGYRPVSRALTGYERDYRAWRAGRLARDDLVRRTTSFAGIVERAIGRVRRVRVTGETAAAKRLLLAALRARLRALHVAPGGPGYRAAWNRSRVTARAGLTTLQEVRDRARLIPLPEDAVS